MLFDVVQHLLQFEDRQQNHGGTDGNRKIHGGRHRVAVREGEHTKERLTAGCHLGHPVPQLKGIRDQIRMAEPHPLGLVRGAARK